MCIPGAWTLLESIFWKCQTVAIQVDPDKDVRLICVVNARGKLSLPEGFYRNAGEITGRPLDYAIDLVKEAKNSVDEEYLRSVAGLMMTKGRPHLTMVRTYVVSGVRYAGFWEIDFGWGTAVYGGPAGEVDEVKVLASYYMPINKKDGKKGIIVPISLPSSAMDRFIQELNMMLEDRSCKL